MKALLSAAALFVAALVCHADLDLSKVKINGTTNKSALSYKAGEEMVYKFCSCSGSAKAMTARSSAEKFLRIRNL